MATFVPTHEFGKYLGDGVAALASHTFKAVLTNTAPTQAGSTTLSGITQISSTGGYAAVTLTGVTWSETGAGTGIWEFDSAAFSWTASGASFDTARYIVIYDDTPTSPADPLVGYIDYGSGFAVTNGNSLTVTPGANGIFRLTVA